ncbi:MAG: isoprenylcysteine carboxylmethyltransferase family protein [Halobacteriota archaeon]|nr:isoprenylcysteine carboxylmethyltransferase family protein [Halobacteriota archaeon]
MAVNPHFEMTVFVKESDHKVVTSGPYKFVRHPGYAAELIGAPSYPLILGSWWGLVPTLVLILVFVIRTALEDRTLQEELPGYKEYAKTMRYRLILFIW